MSDHLDRLTAGLADRYRIERELGVGGMAMVYLAHDVRHDRKVALKVLRPELAAVIGGDRELAGRLFGPGVDPVGREVIVDALPFTVIGMLRKKFQDSNNNYRFVDNLVVQPRDASLGPAVKAEIYRVLGRKYRFDPADTRALGIWDFIEDLKETRSIGLGIQIFMGLVGVFTLLVAGIGVANIMYVVVRERTHEIGVKLAMGARRVHIMGQFMFEALAITLAGGFAGLAVAGAIVGGVSQISTESNPAMMYLLRPVVSWPIVLLSVGILLVVGLLAGVLPARRAAGVDPVESLRYE
jgi:putative ABC transport system permease protein